MRAIGHVDEVTLFFVSGWAADAEDLSAAVTVAIFVDGVDVGRVAARQHRAGLETIAPGATGDYAFAFHFAAPLSPFRDHDIVVRVDPDDTTLDPGTIRRAAVGHDTSGKPPADLRPILVSAMAGADPVGLMDILAAHKDIVVADGHPYEAELLTYYTHALRALIAAGDHERARRPRRVTAGAEQFAIGWNRFLEAGFPLRFKDPAAFNGFVTTTLPSRLAAAFRDVIIAFYHTVARDQGKPGARYLAEHAPLEDLVRRGARYMFGAVSEIVLVRDPRDTLCALIGDGAEVDQALAALAAAADQAVAIHHDSGGDIRFARHEDLLARPAPAMAGILAFLGLDGGGPAEAFAARESGAESIGRWRHDLDAAMLRRCARFEAFHRLFGYEVEPPPPAPAVLRARGQDGEAEQVPEDPERHRALMLKFESLGENCEFGLVQRRCGAEPLGLLRFSSSPYPKLLNALHARFEGLGLPGNLEVQLSGNGREYMILDRKFGFFYHAWVNVGELTPEEIHARETRRVPFLARKLIEDFTAGEKIFVFHGMDTLSDEQARALSRALRAYGPTRLLWVEQAGPDGRPGTVDPLGDGLYKGHIDRFAPGENAHDFSLDCWIRLCGNAVAASE